MRVGGKSERPEDGKSEDRKVYQYIHCNEIELQDYIAYRILHIECLNNQHSIIIFGHHHSNDFKTGFL